MKNILVKIYGIVDTKDIAVIVGLCLLWYGLYLEKPWVSFSVVGLIIILISLFYGRMK